MIRLAKMATPAKRIFSIIIIVLLAISLVSGAKKWKTTYYTVLENSRALMRCEFPKDNPSQVLWVKGKMGVMSLDGEDFHSIAEMLDPQLKNNFRLEFHGKFSELVIDKTIMDDPEIQHPGSYKCIVDLISENKYELSVVKDDLRCEVNHPSDLDEPMFVGTKMQIQCSVTKDRVPRGALEFTLLVDGDKVDTKFILGEDMWRAETNVAKITFDLDLVKEYQNKSIAVRLEINQFEEQRNADEMPRVQVVDRLRLTYGLSVDCPETQYYICESVFSVLEGNSTLTEANRDESQTLLLPTLIEANQDESQTLPLPYCDVKVAAELSLPYRVNWLSKELTEVSLNEAQNEGFSSIALNQIQNEGIVAGNGTSSDDDGPTTLSDLGEDFIDESTEKLGPQTYRVFLAKKSADEFVRQSQNHLRFRSIANMLCKRINVIYGILKQKN